MLRGPSHAEPRKALPELGYNEKTTPPSMRDTSMKMDVLTQSMELKSVPIKVTKSSVSGSFAYGRI